jgi:hypothetical protein
MNATAWSEKPIANSSRTVAWTLVVCGSDGAALKANLLASPCLGPSSSHEVIVVRNGPSAADGLNLGLERARTDGVILVHQDVLLPADWESQLRGQLHEAERQFRPIGVAGVYGVGEVRTQGTPAEQLCAERIGWVVDRGRVLRHGTELPARVATLDELMLILPRNTPLRFDPALGFHLYGADLCIQARERGLAVVALGALCHHNSLSLGLPQSFFASAEVFAHKWAHRLPVATPCVVFDREGGLHLLGNAVDGSVAYGVPMRGSRPRL